MRHLFYTLLFFFLPTCFEGNFIYGQDTILYKSREKAIVKLVEIGREEVKYKKVDNLSGPIYVVKTEEIEAVILANGVVERFGKKSSAQYPVPEPSINFEKIQSHGDKFYHKHRPLSEGLLTKMILRHPDVTSRTVLTLMHGEMKKYKKKQVFSFAAGLGCAVYVPVFTGVFSEETDNPAPVIIAGSALALAAVTTAYISYKYNKRKRYEKKKEIIDLYNRSLQ